MISVPIEESNLQHHAGTVHSTRPLKIQSLPQEWAYTVSLPLQLATMGLSLPVVVSVDLTVHEGNVGLLAVAGDLTTLLGRVSPPVGQGPQRLEVVVESYAADARLVFRNHTRGGRACVFTVTSVHLKAAGDDVLRGASRLAEVMTSDDNRLDVAKLRAAVSRGSNDGEDDEAIFAQLRQKWSTVPAGLSGRQSSGDLVAAADDELRRLWDAAHREATTGSGFDVRGWYQLLYRDVLRGKRVLEIGSGLGLDGIEFARHGAQMTFVDIVSTNLEVLSRLCRLFGIGDARFVYLESLSSLGDLPSGFDVVWCQGSLINAPMAFAARECAAIIPHLKVGGRWIELAYPRERWERDGRPPFSIWGTMTDGEGTPWMEWYDLSKLRSRLAPAQFDVVLEHNFHQDDFNWFDLVRRA